MRFIWCFILLLITAPAYPAQLVIMRADTNEWAYVRGVYQAGDVVGVFRDAHSFSPDEMRLFDIIKIPGTRDEVNKRLNERNPEITIDEKTGKEYVKNPDDGKEYEIKVINKYQFSVNGLKYKDVTKESIKIKILEEPENLETVKP